MSFGLDDRRTQQIARSVKLPLLPLTLIFLLSPSTPMARPTVVCDCAVAVLQQHVARRARRESTG